MNKNKVARFNCRFTQSEYDKLVADSNAFGYKKLSDFGRYKMLLDINTKQNILVSKSLKDEVKIFNYHINKLGNNVNQIAKAIYTNNISHKSAISELEESMAFLYRLGRELYTKIK